MTCSDKMCIENLKLLGVTIDYGLNFGMHKSNVRKRLGACSCSLVQPSLQAFSINL